jgi:hypothetical protein
LECLPRHTIRTAIRPPSSTALTLLVADLEKKKIAASGQLRARREAATRSRHVPAAVKREVWKPDGGQRAFEGTNGRCAERGFLEFHHVVPYAMGGETATTNRQLRLWPTDLWHPICAMNLRAERQISERT